MAKRRKQTVTANIQVLATFPREVDADAFEAAIRAAVGGVASVYGIEGGKNTIKLSIDVKRV